MRDKQKQNNVEIDLYILFAVKVYYLKVRSSMNIKMFCPLAPPAYIVLRGQTWNW